ncbi:MAG: hypothetical protein KGJ90_00480 [Patescibacteria group bacterium]|nr:hypothetical protein [Patescibacteria group bacterium]
MPNVNTTFQGFQLIVPAAYYADNVSASYLPPQPTTPPLIFIGYGYGPKPQTANTYFTPTDLLNAIRGGPASGYVQFLCNPSNQLNGAQQVTFIDVSENTQSSLTLYSGASGVINLKSSLYGLPSNLLQVSIAAGSTAGDLVTLYDGYANYTVVGDNLGVPFQVSYLGSSSGVTYSVTVSGGVATNFSTNSPVSGQSVSIPLNSANFATVEAVVEYLNGTGYYSANVISSTNGQLPSTYLDAASGLGLASGGVLVNITATLGDIIYWFNQFADYAGGGAIATATSGAFTSSTAVLPSHIGLTPFSGATSVPPITSDYASGFNLALALPGWTVYADSNSSAVVALGTQHAVTASEVINGKWRRFFSGSSIGDSIATATATAIAQNAITTSYVYPGIYRTDSVTGINTLFSGHKAAAAIAGMATGNPPNTPLTNKTLVGNGVEVSLTVSQINTLQQAGVMPIYIPNNTPGVPTVVQDLTTWQNDSNPANVHSQQVACRWFLAYTMVNALQPYVGSIASTLTETQMLNAAKSALNASIYNGSNNGVLNSWNPATLSITYTGANQTAYVTVEVVLVGQNVFIEIFVPIQPLNFTVSLNQNGIAAT